MEGPTCGGISDDEADEGAEGDRLGLFEVAPERPSQGLREAGPAGGFLDNRINVVVEGEMMDGSTQRILGV